MSKTQKPTVGVDLGGTNIQFGVVDENDSIISRYKCKTKASQGTEAIVGRLVDGIEQVCKDADVKPNDLAAVGIASAGAIDFPNGIVLNSPNLGWRDLPLRAMLEEKLNTTVVLENDVNGAIWGEYCLGAGKDYGDMFGIWIGTGVGGGLVLNNRLYRGDFFTAGEIGHTVVKPYERPGRGKLEEVASRTGMSRSVLSRWHHYPDSIMHELIDCEEGIYRSKLLLKGLEANDPLMLDVVDDAAWFLGISIANVVTLLALNTVIVGGGVGESLGKPFLKKIKQSFDEHVFPEELKACTFITTILEDDAGLLGAALLARETA